MNKIQGIYLLGSERSGSNLLRTLLGNHSQIAAPIAPHLCLTFRRHFKNYLPVSDKANTHELLSDINSVVNHPFHDWKIELMKTGVEDLKMESFINFLHYTYSSYSIEKGKSHYFCKDNNNHEFALGMLKDIPDVKFIYLVRDPRDQVASWMRTPIHLLSPYAANRKWKDEQTYILSLRDFFKVEMHLIKYENLVDHPEIEMKKVLDFLDLPDEATCYQTKKENKEAEKHPLWKNINKPVKKKNYGKYKDVLSESDIHMIETIDKALMKELGYSSTTAQSWKVKSRFKFRLNEIIRRNQSKKKSAQFKKGQMKILDDKRIFLQELFSKFKK